MQTKIQRCATWDCEHNKCQQCELDYIDLQNGKCESFKDYGEDNNKKEIK